MRRSPLVLMVTGLALAGAGCGANDQLIPADQARSLDSTLQQVADATRGGECRQALDDLAAAQRLYANLPDSVDQRLAARLKQGLDQLARTVPTQCAAAPTTPTQPTTTSTSTTSTSSSTPTTTTTTTAPPTTTTTTTPSTTTPPTQTGTGTTQNGGITPDATGTAP